MGWGAKLAVGSCLLGACQTATIEARAGGALRDIDGSIGIDTGGSPTGNSTAALGLERDDFSPEIGIEVRYDGGQVRFVGFQSSHDGAGVLDHAFSKGPVTIPAGTAVESSFEVGLYSAIWTANLLDTRGFDGGLGGGVALIDLEAGFRSQANADEIFSDELLPIPVLAGRLAYHSGPFDFACHAAGLAIDFGGDRANFFDLDASAKWRLIGKRYQNQWALIAGYRFLHAGIDYDASQESVDASLQLFGPYLGIHGSF